MPRVILVVAAIALTVYAAADCWSIPDRNFRVLSKRWWLVIIVLMPVFGPLTWLLAGRSTARPVTPRSRPMAPDEDPEFLARLERENRERLRRQRPTDEQ